jgi:pyruvate,water dikinase
MRVPLDRAIGESTYGGKAANLAVALQAGLPVPPGFALSTEAVDAVVAGDPDAVSLLHDAFARLGGPVAVRSSAVGEDSLSASFAGQYTTRLNVSRQSDLVDAVREVWESGRSEAALHYRQRLGLTGNAAMGVVVQQLIVPDAAGVLFTRNPVTDVDERVIEACWGLGEAVVMGLVTPDRYRVSREGEVMERTPGRKDRMVLPSASGDTEEVPVEPDRVYTLCLDDGQLLKLHELGARCEAIRGTARDIEWAFAAAELYLLQQRDVTG